MTDTSMIERVARAAYEKFIEDVRDLEPKWDDLPQSHRDRMITSQRAAIEVMREPTPSMLQAGVWADSEDGASDNPQNIWQGMIDKALES